MYSIKLIKNNSFESSSQFPVQIEHLLIKKQILFKVFFGSRSKRESRSNVDESFLLQQIQS